MKDKKRKGQRHEKKESEVKENEKEGGGEWEGKNGRNGVGDREEEVGERER